MSQPRDQPYFVFVHGYDAHSPYQQRGVFHHTWDPEGETPHSEELAHDALALEQLRGPRWFPGRSPRDFVHAAGRRILSTDFYRLPAIPAEGESVIELSPGEVEHIRAHYDAGLTYADHWLGVLLSEVDLDETLVVVLADHGEDLLDHGFINHRAGLWDSTLHVPLVVAGPGFRGGRQESGRVDLRSVLPTLLLAAGAPPPAGVSAKPLQENPALPYVFAEGVMDMVSVRGPRGRLSLDNAGLTRGNPPIAPQSLDSGDFTFFFEPAPDDLIPKNIARPDAEELKRALAEWRQGLPQGPALPGSTDPALRSALQERGYWEPETEPSPDGLAPSGAPPAEPSTP
jgi:membrane-anchored protein YejM (alkaline phosphatase superfamily)